MPASPALRPISRAQAGANWIRGGLPAGFATALPALFTPVYDSRGLAMQVWTCFFPAETISAELQGVPVHSLNEPLLVGAGASSTDSQYNNIPRGMGELDGYCVII